MFEKRITHNDTIRIRKSNIFLFLYSIFYEKRKANQNKKTSMHDTVCTLDIQTNAHSELKNKPNTHTHFNAKEKACNRHRGFC